MGIQVDVRMKTDLPDAFARLRSHLQRVDEAATLVVPGTDPVVAVVEFQKKRVGSLDHLVL